MHSWVPLCRVTEASYLPAMISDVPFNETRRAELAVEERIGASRLVCSPCRVSELILEHP